MDYRPLDITVISATGLKNVNLFMKMGVYVVVSLINGDSVTKKKTHVSNGGCNPRWSHRIKFSVEEAAIQSTTLLFVLRCSRILGDRVIGEVSIPLRDLLDSTAGSENLEHVVDYQVRSIKGKSRGTLTFSHQLKGKVTQSSDSGVQNKTSNNNTSSGEDSVKSYTSGRTSTSYPTNPSGMLYLMPQQQQQQGMSPYPQASYPPPQGYGAYPGHASYNGMWYPQAYPYHPQQMGYAYNQQMQQQPQPPRKSEERKIGGSDGGKLALGLGAGLIGGLLVGDMVSDIGEMAEEEAMDSEF